MYHIIFNSSIKYQGFTFACRHKDDNDIAYYVK